MKVNGEFIDILSKVTILNLIFEVIKDSHAVVGTNTRILEYPSSDCLHDNNLYS